MLTAMVWGRKNGKVPGFPAIDIRPRHPIVPNPGARSSRSPINRPRTSDTITRPPIESTTAALEVLSSADVLVSLSHESVSASTSLKRPRLDSVGVSSGPRQRRLHKCSICSQIFARAEHLIRHERSHRKERPFSCVHCSATFTRKDLVKRHLKRYHPGLIPINTAAANAPTYTNEHPDLGEDRVGALERDASPNGTNETNHPQPGQEEQRSHFETAAHDHDHNLGQHSAEMEDSVPDDQIEDNPLDHFDFESLMRDIDGSQLLIHTPSISGHGHASNNGLHFVFDSPVNQLPEAASIELNDAFATSNVAAASLKTGSPDMDPAQFICLLEPDSVHGSFSISERKRSLIVQDTETAFSLARIPETFRMPSSVALERYITVFFNAFLIHAPCIHVPTFRAENTQPSVILAMAALGANYHEERDVAICLHRAARLSILNQMEKTSFSTKGRPSWILQSLFFTMTFGVWRNDFDAVQESLAFQSNLAHIVRYVSHPGARWVEGTQDASLSWEEWIELESAKRTKFVIYTFFNDLTMAYNVPPVLTNLEVDMDLPCDESVWTADSAISWSGRRTTSTSLFQGTLRSLMSASDIHAIRCSTFGCHIILSAILQQIWQSRQAASPSESLVELEKFDSVLQNWQIIAAKADTMGLEGSKVTSSLSYHSMDMLRLAYVILCLDMSRLKAVICRQDVQDIAHAMRSHCSDIGRSSLASKAALFAVYAFRRVVKSGINVVARTGSLKINPQSYLSWFDTCEFLD